MKNSIVKIALCGLAATGLLAYGQNPAAPPQPGTPQAQSQGRTPAQQGETAKSPAQSQSPAAGQAAGAEEVFAALDTNHDGKLSAEEFGKLFRNAKEADVMTEFTRWDKNGDKSLTMEEFKASYPQQPK